MDSPDTEPPAKRSRLSKDEVQSDFIAPFAPAAPKENDIVFDEINEQLGKELKVGLTEFVLPNETRFSGVLKQRYTDFLVNEIAPGGIVIRLKSLDISKRKPDEQLNGSSDDSKQPQSRHPTSHKIVDKSDNDAAPTAEPVDTSAEAASYSYDLNEDDRLALVKIFGEPTVNSMLSLHSMLLKSPNRKPGDRLPPVVSAPIDDRELRTEAHQLVRRIFSSRLETNTQEGNAIRVIAAPPPRKRQNLNSNATNDGRYGARAWEDLGGEHLHFTIYKENRDTMEVISFLSGQTKANSKRFAFSGTKDRRGVTVQRASVFRMRAEQLVQVGRKGRGWAVGDFEYAPEGLELGQLGGNEFGIVLRDCHFPGEEGLTHEGRESLAHTVVGESVKSMNERGFINYYGLQRFGSFATTTDGVGLKLLQGDLQGAIDMILDFNPIALEPNTPGVMISSDDRARAEGINLWRTRRDKTAALQRIPRKFSAETQIITWLGSKHGAKANDFQGALMSIPRNLRRMYVHAYQSLVWNHMASERWRLYGDKVVAGDLVVIEKHDSNDPDPTIDEEGEPIVKPAPEDSAGIGLADDFERARPLSEAEAASGEFSISNVVLPLPGFDVEYPSNAVGKAYETFMASDRGGGLDPHNMRRSWKDISLSGGYRKLMARAKTGMAYEVKWYSRDDQQLVETDLQRIKRGEHTHNEGDDIEPVIIGEGQLYEGHSKLAVVLHMQLGPSQYATMALRELMGPGGARTYKPDFGGGR